MVLKNTEKYSPERMEALRSYLERIAERNAPIDYAIRIDGLCAVPRTSDIHLFDLHKTFITEVSRSVEVIFFRHKSNNADKRIFLIENNTVYEPAHGFCQPFIKEVEKQFGTEDTDKILSLLMSIKEGTTKIDTLLYVMQ